MTAIPGRRKRSTVIGGVTATLLMVVALSATFIGVLTLRDSEEGESVGIDTRPVVTFPTTSNLALAVADDDGRLASLVIATLLPEGTGGSIVTVPVNADATVGLGPARQPINSVFSADDPDGLAQTIESLLSIAVERVEIVDGERLGELLDPLLPVDVDLPEDVVDSDAIGSGIVVPSGERSLRRSLFIDAMTAIDDSGDLHDHHPLKVELWSAVGANTPIETAAPDDVTDAPPPATSEEFLDRLWAGEVQVRDLDIDPGLAALADNPDDLDVVVLDRRDSLLVFAQVSPSLVSTPNEGLIFRLEVRFSDDQLAAAGDRLASRSQVSRTLVGELLFFSANVVSVDPMADEAGAPSVTRVEVAQERFLDELVEFAPLIFGESDVVVAEELIDGVDVIVKLGTGYLDLQDGRGGDTVESE